MKETAIYLVRNRILRAAVAAFLFTAAYVTIIMPLKPAAILNLKLYDLVFSAFYKYRTLPHSVMDKLVLVSIDDESFRRMNLRWPWPRGVTAGVIKNISECGPSLICLDLIYVGKSLDEKQDLITAKAMQDSGNVIAGAYLADGGRYVIPEDMIARSLKDFGFIDKPRDADGFSRRSAPYIITDPGNVYQYNLAVIAAAALAGKKPADLVHDIPLTKRSDMYINFYGGADKFSVVPAWKVFESGKEALAGLFKDKAVFVGATSEMFHDIYPTPLGRMAGVAIAMNEAIGYIKKDFLRPAARNIDFAVIFLFVAAAVFAELHFRSLRGMIFLAFDIAVFFALAFFALSRNTILDYLGVPLLIALSSLSLYSYRYVSMIAENAALKREAVTDGLTQLYVYRYFELSLRMKFKKAVEREGRIALVFYDIDHFKKINDTYGHEFGNQVLVTIAKTLKKYTRDSGTLARYGGEEFCTILPDAGAKDAIIYAERIRDEIKKLDFKTGGGEVVKVTISGGIVTNENSGDITDYKDFIKAADSALYRSKQTGRDRISVFDKNTDKLD